MAHGLEQANAMTKSSRRNQVDEPQIFPGCSAHVEETERMSTPTEERGDLLIRDITDCILDVRITSLDAPSNIHRKPEAVFFPRRAKSRRNSSKSV